MQKVHWALLSCLVLSILLSGCLLASLSRNPVLQGRVLIEKFERDNLQGDPVPNATVQALDIENGKILAETRSNQEGYYFVSVPPGGPYLIQVIKGNLKLLDFSPITEENKIYNLDLAGISSTAITLVFLEATKEGHDPQSVDIDSVTKITKFEDLLGTVQKIVANSGNPLYDKEALQLAREIVSLLFLNPLPPSPSSITETPVSLPPIHNTTRDKYYFTMQSAIDDARNGDIIVASPGTYRENIDFKGKNITLQSENPDDPQVAAKTIIDGANRGSVVTFQSGESSEAVLRGFTIQNGSGNTSSQSSGLFCGGGIFIKDSSPTLEKNLILQNSADHGGGIYIENGSPSLRGNIIEANTSAIFGGGICIVKASPIIGGSNIDSKNIIQNNQSDSGGGIYADKDSTITSDGILWDRAFYAPPSGWLNPNYTAFNALLANTHAGGDIGSQVYFEARNVTFTAAGSGEINVSGSAVTNQSLSFPIGATLEIEATPGKEHLFQQWTASAGTVQDKSQYHTTYLVPQNDATITASFLPLREFTFQIQGSGSIDVSVVSRPVTHNDFEGSITTSFENHQYVQGTVLNLKATPSTNYGFLKWVVDGVDYSSDCSIALTASQNTIIQAVFGFIREITFKVNPDDGTNVGSIFVNGVEVLDGKTKTQTVQYYPEGKNITVEARDLAGDFQNWSTGSSNPHLSYEVAGNATITASFTTPPIKNITRAAYFRTIRDATFSAQAGETVEVNPGIYYENGITISEGVTLKSTDGRDATIIDGNNTSPGITLQSGALIEGFTIQNFSSSAVYVAGENCTVRNNNILNNKAENGGGIYVSSEANSCEINGNTIEHNQASDNGGGIYVSAFNSGTSIHENTVQYNHANNMGGGMYIDANISYYSNIVYKNTAGSGCSEIYTVGGLCE